MHVSTQLLRNYSIAYQISRVSILKDSSRDTRLTVLLNPCSVVSRIADRCTLDGRQMNNPIDPGKRDLTCKLKSESPTPIPRLGLSVLGLRLQSHAYWVHASYPGLAGRCAQLRPLYLPRLRVVPESCGR